MVDLEGVLRLGNVVTSGTGAQVSKGEPGSGGGGSHRSEADKDGSKFAVGSDAVASAHTPSHPKP